MANSTCLVEYRPVLFLDQLGYVPVLCSVVGALRIVTSVAIAALTNIAYFFALAGRALVNWISPGTIAPLNTLAERRFVITFMALGEFTRGCYELCPIPVMQDKDRIRQNAEQGWVYRGETRGAWITDGEGAYALCLYIGKPNSEGQRPKAYFGKSCGKSNQIQSPKRVANGTPGCTTWHMSIVPDEQQMFLDSVL